MFENEKVPNQTMSNIEGGGLILAYPPLFSPLTAIHHTHPHTHTHIHTGRAALSSPLSSPLSLLCLSFFSLLSLSFLSLSLLSLSLFSLLTLSSLSSPEKCEYISHDPGPSFSRARGSLEGCGTHPLVAVWGAHTAGGSQEGRTTTSNGLG